MGHRFRDFKNERVFAGLKGEVLGAKAVPCSDHGGYPDREGTRRWRLTDDLADLRLADDVFIACGDYEELIDALESRFASPVDGLSRVERVTNGWAYDAKRGVQFRQPPTDACVHAYPFVDPWIAANEDDLTEQGLIAGLSMMAVSCPLIVSGGKLETLKGRAFFDSDLTVNDTDFAGDPAPKGYRFLKYNPVMARARRTREANAEMKKGRATVLNQQTAELRATILTAAGRMRDALCGRDDGLFRVLRRPEDVVNEPATRRHGYRRPVALLEKTDRYGRCLYGGWDGARVLHAYALLYDTAFGRGAHRKLAAFQDLLARLREARRDVKEIKAQDYGADASVTAWFDAAIKARRPRGRASVVVGDVTGKPRPGRRAADPGGTVTIVPATSSSTP